MESPLYEESRDVLVLLRDIDGPVGILPVEPSLAFKLVIEVLLMLDCYGQVRKAEAICTNCCWIMLVFEEEAVLWDLCEEAVGAAFNP